MCSLICVPVVVGQKMDLNSCSRTYGPTLGLSWLMCSLAPINQPRAVTINLGWLLIGAEGDTGGGGLLPAVYRNLPSSSRLICSHVSALWLVRWNPLGWKALVASSPIYQDHTHGHTQEHAPTVKSYLLYQDLWDPFLPWLQWHLHPSVKKCISVRWTPRGRIRIWNRHGSGSETRRHAFIMSERVKRERRRERGKTCSKGLGWTEPAAMAGRLKTPYMGHLVNFIYEYWWIFIQKDLQLKGNTKDLG